MSMNLSDKQLDMLMELSAALMPLEEIADVLEVNFEMLSLEYKNRDSIVYKKIRAGFLQTKTSIHKSIIECAKNGSSPAHNLSKEMIEDAGGTYQ